MAIEAYLEDGWRGQDKRGAARRKLRLELPAEAEGGEPVGGVIRDLSETGFLLQSPADLVLGARLTVHLPQAGAALASVVWAGQGLFGCRFDTPIARAAISAAQLRSTPEDAAGPQPAAAESFGQRLRRLRKQRRITLIGLARLVNVSKPTVWKWERDEVRPRQKSLDALAEVLGVPSRELLLGRKEGGLPASAQPEGAEPRLSATIRDCKERIAEYAGTTPDNVTVTIRA